MKRRKVCILCLCRYRRPFVHELALIRSQISLLIFPEGTRHNSPEPDLLPFKKGAFYLAVQAGAPIIPVVCQNYHHLFDGKTRFKSGTLRLRSRYPLTFWLQKSEVD